MLTHCLKHVTAWSALRPFRRRSVVCGIMAPSHGSPLQFRVDSQTNWSRPEKRLNKYFSFLSSRSIIRTCGMCICRLPTIMGAVVFFVFVPKPDRLFQQIFVWRSVGGVIRILPLSIDYSGIAKGYNQLHCRRSSI